ncbi:MAG: helix-turn-helix domain-containing protein [Fimbriimonadaceae bacterium]|nr:helix-turn-helix domain-containing protein [Fimbriimonadaceae bacterium]QYK55886.1 MAG: helix-turn-helix domain-containing protein [Fimbriimonadaceae bacterium]
MNEILQLASAGRSDKEIAAILEISPQTVESHWKRLRDKFGFSSRAQIIATALGEMLRRAEAERDELRKQLEAERAKNRAQVDRAVVDLGPKKPEPTPVAED